MKKIQHCNAGLALLALTAWLCLGRPAGAQSAPTQDTRSAQDRDANREELASFDRFLDNHRVISEQLRKDPSLMDDREFVKNHPALQTYLQDHPGVREAIKQDPNRFMREENRFDRREDDRDRGANRQELARFDRFLDNHREISEQLRKNPSLVDDREFVKNHPELQTFLQDHPGVREEIKQDPNRFMREENRFDRREDDRDRGANRGELANLDRFLDNHREISEQLRKNPSLADNREFLTNHPALQTYLQDHPGVREQLRENPNAFMREENRFDRREDNRDGRANRQELASLDRFLDNHREVSEQLRKDPSLVDDREFVKNHPALQTYLQDHPGVREEIKQNPNRFMQEEARYDRHESGMDRDRDDHRSDFNRDITHRRFGEFLGGHADIAEQLSRNPSLVKDQKFMDGHPEFKNYLNSNPDVREKLMSNPDGFVKASQPSSTGNGQSVKPPAAKPKPNQ